MCPDILIIKPLEYSPFEIIDVNLYNKKNNTWELGDMKFIFSCSISIFTITVRILARSLANFYCQ